MVNAVARELLGGRSAEDEVALEARIDDLNNDLLVREADDQAVLGCVVLVLRLGDQSLARIVCTSHSYQYFRTQLSEQQCVTHSRFCPRGDGGT